MARRLSVAPSALADLEFHWAWLTQDGAGDVARKQLAAIRTAIRELKHSPARWPKSPDHPGVRQRVVGRDVLIYQVDLHMGRDSTAGDVVLLRVFGPGQSRERLT